MKTLHKKILGNEIILPIAWDKLTPKYAGSDGITFGHFFLSIGVH